jgi:hypothetical protein
VLLHLDHLDLLDVNLFLARSLGRLFRFFRVNGLFNGLRRGLLSGLPESRKLLRRRLRRLRESRRSFDRVTRPGQSQAVRLRIEP